VNSGAWANKAVKEAQKVGTVNVIANTAKDIPTRIPAMETLKFTPGAAYVHITSNETIAGAQWKAFPKTEAPLVADMSSDILSRPFDVKDFGLIYAGAQKNLGPSGMAVVAIRKEFAEKGSTTIPTMLQYRTYVDENSLYNTPPTWGIYIFGETMKWVKKMGKENLFKLNAEKAKKIYDVIDGSGFYRGTALKEYRSNMNVTWRLPTEELEAQFIKEAAAAGMKSLKGHRSVGGIRASIYNAFPMAGVDCLVDFMKEFEKKNG
jgi:phosphoserine aminotransferase